jgi:hypothetical protein
MFFLEQSAQTRFVHGWSIQRGHEFLPLAVAEHKVGLVGEFLLGLFAGAKHDELRHIYPPGAPLLP